MGVYLSPNNWHSLQLHTHTHTHTNPQSFLQVPGIFSWPPLFSQNNWHCLQLLPPPAPPSLLSFLQPHSEHSLFSNLKTWHFHRPPPPPLFSHSRYLLQNSTLFSKHQALSPIPHWQPSREAAWRCFGTAILQRGELGQCVPSCCCVWCRAGAACGLRGGSVRRRGGCI